MTTQTEINKPISGYTPVQIYPKKLAEEEGKPVSTPPSEASNPGTSPSKGDGTEAVKENKQMDTKPYPIIGMSPGNSYFKDAQIRYLLKEMVERFGRTCVIVPDVPAISTYLAYGYPENKARAKAIRQGTSLKNRTRRLMKELAFEPSQVRIVEWATEVAENLDYRRIYDLRVKKLYESNLEFSRSVDTATRDVLEAFKRPISDMNAAIKIAVYYLLSELAFIEFAPQFLDSTHVTSIYHRNWSVYEDYTSGKFDGQVRPHLGFLLLESPYELSNQQN
jgi:tRNA-dependent cyclodipeptide synthase